ncbi:MAG: hypothetical protein ACFCUT_06830 [Kiloniellaceae bacterium]
MAFILQRAVTPAVIVENGRTESQRENDDTPKDSPRQQIETWLIYDRRQEAQHSDRAAAIDHQQGFEGLCVND